jgi:hypothetical protein
MNLGTLFIYTKFWTDRSSNLDLENQLSTISPELMAGLCQNFYNWYNYWKDTKHDAQVFALTYFSRSQRSKFKTNYKVGLFCYYLT